MKKFKKLLAIALVAASPCTMLASASSEADELKEIETIVWYVNNGNTITDKQAVQDAINEYIGPKIGVNVSIVTSAEEPELSLALAAGEDIDIFWTAFWANGNNYIADNSALDLTDLLPNYPELYSSIPENVWTAAQKDGRNYFVPVYKEAAGGSTYMYSVAAAEKYGWDMSTVNSFEDLTPMLEQMKQDGAKCAFIPYIESFRLDMLGDYCIKEATVAISREDNKVVNILETDEYKKYVDLLYSWNQAGYISQEAVDYNYVNDESNKADLLASGDAAFTYWSSTPDAEANATIRYGTEMKTLFDTDKYLTINGTFGSAYMINNSTDQADACLKFLGLLYTDQTVADLICYGIEDTHYTRDTDGYVSLIADSGYTSGGVWATCSVMSASLQVGESADKKEQYASYNENALVTPEDSFVFDTTNVTAEYSAVMAVYNEYEYLLDTGFYNPDEYLPKYQSALKEAGLETIMTEMQNQYDAFLAK